MTEHQGRTIGLDFDIWLDTLPAVELGRLRGIVVPRDEMFAAAESSEQFHNDGRTLANGEVAQMPHLIIRSDRRVPPLDQGFVHCCHRGKWPPIEAQRTAMSEMCVTSEEDCHRNADMERLTENESILM